jgi:hypothetical protein
MAAFRIEPRLRWGVFFLGILMAMVALLAWRVPGGSGAAGLDLTISVAPSGELQLTPSGPVVSAKGLIPGAPDDGAGGSFVVRNRTGTKLDIRIQALPSSVALDDTLEIDIQVGGSELFSGRLGALRRWTEKRFVLNSGQAERLVVWVWLPPGTRAYQGWAQDVSLRFQSAPVGG